MNSGKQCMNKIVKATKRQIIWKRTKQKFLKWWIQQLNWKAYWRSVTADLIKKKESGHLVLFSQKGIKWRGMKKPQGLMGHHQADQYVLQKLQKNRETKRKKLLLKE